MRANILVRTAGGCTEMVASLADVSVRVAAVLVCALLLHMHAKQSPPR